MINSSWVAWTWPNPESEFTQGLKFWHHFFISQHQTFFGNHDSAFFLQVVSFSLQNYVSLIYDVELKRKTTYYTHLFVAPSVLMMFAIPAMFLIPPESNEKITLGLFARFDSHFFSLVCAVATGSTMESCTRLRCPCGGLPWGLLPRATMCDGAWHRGQTQGGFGHGSACTGGLTKGDTSQQSTWWGTEWLLCWDSEDHEDCSHCQKHFWLAGIGILISQVTLLHMLTEFVPYAHAEVPALGNLFISNLTRVSKFQESTEI